MSPLGEIKMTLTFDPAGKGLEKVLKDYQEEALRFVWKTDVEGLSSRQVWTRVNEVLPGGRTISRASIINFLNAMVDEGVLNYTETTGKGGYRRIYSPRLDERAFRKHIAETVLKSLLGDFPQETEEVVQELNL
jgi:predicted transcriptional regulator